MTVRELIAKLSTMPQELPVYVTWEGIHLLRPRTSEEITVEVKDKYYPVRVEIYADQD